MRIAPSDPPILRADLPAPEPRASFADMLGGAGPVTGGLPGDPPGLAGPQPTPPGPSAPIRPDVSETDARSRAGAASFDAFGMFGRRAETVLIAATPVPGTGEAAPATAGSVSAPEAAVPPLAPTAGLPVHAARPGAVLHGAVQSVATQPARHGVQGDARPETGERALPEAAVADEEDAAPGAVRRRTAQTSAETEARTRLTLSETADAAGLTVRLAGLSAEEAAQFRARARTLLGEHGLRLDTLDINGEDRSRSDLPTWGMTQWR
jgi:hypothetical protein